MGSTTKGNDGDARDRELLELSVLAEIGQLLTATLDVNGVYERFAEIASQLLPFDRIAIAELDVAAGTLTTTYESGIHIEAWGIGKTRPMFGPLNQMALESGGAMMLDKELAIWVVTEYPEFQDILDAGLYSTLAVPIVSDGKPIAYFAINSTAEAAYTAEDGILAERIVSQIGGVVANALIRAELQQEVAHRITLAEIGRLVSSSADLDDMYMTLAGLVRGLIPFDRITILRANLESDMVTYDYVDGIEVESRAAGDSIPVPSSPFEKVISARSTVWFEANPIEGENVSPVPSPNADHGIKSMVVTPLFSQGNVVGGISLSSLRPHAFSRIATDLLERVAGQVGGAIGVAQLRASVQSEADERVNRLQELDALRLQFLQMVTHEFRTPLASLRVSRDLLAETPLGDLDDNSYTRLINNMGRGVDRLDSLVTDLLDLTIAQAGELTLHLESIDLRDLISDAVEIVSPMASQRNQVFDIDIESPSPVARIDRHRTEQVLLNLLSNSHKYSNENTEISVAAKRKNGVAEIRVTGNGPDIPEADRPHMFEPFFRGSADWTRSTPGRGLGLSIAKAFVELHGGKIGFDSVPGRGPSFYFTLPLSGGRG
ncbi:MAG: GAF domain-containing protein [Chloroflexi bacterium]|nr:GAF domain-containing protein [Chloroflexota bacterium]